MAKQLGYACINMTLAKQGISCNRSMIRRTFQAKGPEYASELILENLAAEGGAGFLSTDLPSSWAPAPNIKFEGRWGMTHGM